MQRILYLVQKEFRQMRREKAFIGIIFVMPLLQIILLGFAITTDVKNITLGLVDYDRSPFSRRTAQAFTENGSFILKAAPDNTEDAVKAMDEGKVKAVIVIPSNFEKDVKEGRSPKIQVIVDGVDGNSAGVVMAYANQITQKLQTEYQRQNQNPKAGMMAAIPQKVKIEPRMLFNPALESKNNIVPGIIAVLVTMITSFLTGMSIVKEKEIGTLEQLMVTPIRNYELILGKIIPFIVVTILMVTVGILAAGLVFDIWMKGNPLMLYFMALVFSMSTLGLGIFASTISNTQQQAMFIAWFFAVFALLLSGFFIPIENMPDWIQYITYLNPLRFFMVIIREIYLKGTPFVFLLKETLAMAAFGALTMTLAVLRFQKRVS